MNIVEKVDDHVKVRHVLVSVTDKTGLEHLIPALVDIHPGVRIYSTGGTFNRIREILGSRAEACLTPVSAYTGQPETQGGLVKTLDFKIYLGLLTETYNPAHRQDLERTSAAPIDMVVVNLYPFEKTVESPEVTVEGARATIDIGGPCMVRASAKNYLRVASVVDPADYERIIAELKATGGCTTLKLRFALAKKAFDLTARFDRAVADFLGARTYDDVAGCYRMS